eukprot:1158966-Pelagomonas_calceolata.AAC.8
MLRSSIVADERATMPPDVTHARWSQGSLIERNTHCVTVLLGSLASRQTLACVQVHDRMGGYTEVTHTPMGARCLASGPCPYV